MILCENEIVICQTINKIVGHIFPPRGVRSGWATKYTIRGGAMGSSSTRLRMATNQECIMMGAIDPCPLALIYHLNQISISQGSAITIHSLVLPISFTSSERASTTRNLHRFIDGALINLFWDSLASDMAH